MRAKVLPIVGAQLALAAAFGFLAARAGAPAGEPAAIGAFAAAWAVVGLFSLRLEFHRQQATFTLNEAVLVVGFFVLGPVGIGIAVALGEGTVWSLQRVKGLKVVFNSVNQMSSAVVAATGFWMLGWRDERSVAAWFAALAAVFCFSLLNLAALTTVLARVENRSFNELFAESVPTGALVTSVSAPLGLIGLVLFEHGWAGPALLLPLVLAVAVNSRDAATQRDEHLRFERLYEAASRTASLAGFDETITRVATEAKELLTGTWALCAAEDASGRWVAVAVDGAGTRRDEHAMRTLRALAEGEPAREIPLGSLGAVARASLPAGASLVLAAGPEGTVAPMVLGVVRDAVATADETAESRVKTLAAFVTHATMAIGNARLLGEVEEALRQQVDLNRQKSDFVAAVSHELRTPLTAMLGSVATIIRLDGRLDPEGRRKLLDMATDQGKRLKRLIEELLTVAAAERVGMDVRHETVDLRRLLLDVRNDLHPAAAARVVLDVTPGAELVVSDRLKLHQIVLNLVENAGKYAPDGAIEVSVGTDGADTTIAVVDHGPGIPAADRTRVFERFVQLDQSSTRRNGGTGLGLYLCRQLAEALGGQITLDDAPAGGCRFTLRIPTARQARREERAVIGTTGRTGRPALAAGGRRP